MTIEIRKSGDEYRAEIVELPGSTPPIGRGPSPEHAVADLFVDVFHESINSFYTTLIRKLNRKITIDRADNEQ